MLCYVIKIIAMVSIVLKKKSILLFLRSLSFRPDCREIREIFNTAYTDIHVRLYGGVSTCLDSSGGVIAEPLHCSSGCLFSIRSNMRLHLYPHVFHVFRILAVLREYYSRRSNNRNYTPVRLSHVSSCFRP
jgi:hypothetical protein